MYVYIYIYLYTNTLTLWRQMLESCVFAFLLVAICRCENRECMKPCLHTQMRAWEHQVLSEKCIDSANYWALKSVLNEFPLRFRKFIGKAARHVSFIWCWSHPFFVPPGETRLQCFCRVQGWSLVAIYLKSSIPAVFNVEVYYHPFISIQT